VRQKRLVKEVNVLAQALLAKVNIDVTAGTEKAGTVAIAYAAHKAASCVLFLSLMLMKRRPIRFPPTVALTPIVAKFLKKNKEV